MGWCETAVSELVLNLVALPALKELDLCRNDALYNDTAAAVIAALQGSVHGGCRSRLERVRVSGQALNESIQEQLTSAIREYAMRPTLHVDFS
jgi:hypothetical protein